MEQDLNTHISTIEYCTKCGKNYYHVDTDDDENTIGCCRKCQEGGEVDKG